MTLAGPNTGRPAGCRPPPPTPPGTTLAGARAGAADGGVHRPKAPAAWIEGQVAQLTSGPVPNVVFLTLRDPCGGHLDVRTCLRSPRWPSSPRPPAEGDRVVVHGKYDFWAARGSLNFKVDKIHPVGLGDLLARLERFAICSPPRV